jgi:hypothetical protein
MGAAALDPQARADQLAAEIAAHKSAIRHHRRQLEDAATRLEHYKRECAARGIKVICIPKSGVAKEHPTHGPTSQSGPS